MKTELLRRTFAGALALLLAFDSSGAGLPGATVVAAPANPLCSRLMEAEALSNVSAASPILEHALFTRGVRISLGRLAIASVVTGLLFWPGASVRIQAQPSANLSPISLKQIDALLAGLLNTSDYNRYIAALVELERLPADPRVDQKLLAAYARATDPAPLDRLNEVLAARYKGNPGIAPRILPFLNDPVETRRGWARLLFPKFGVDRMWTLLDERGMLAPQVNLPRTRGAKTRAGLIIVDEDSPMTIDYTHGDLVEARARSFQAADSNVTVYRIILPPDLHEVHAPIVGFDTPHTPSIRVTAYIQRQIEAIVNAHPDRVFVVNMSMGSQDAMAMKVNGLLEIPWTQAMGPRNVVFVVAVPNDGSGLRGNPGMVDLFPRQDNVLFVSAGNAATATLLDTSFRGRHPGYIFVTADPGREHWGTSFAAPNVAGRLARLLTDHPQMSIPDAKSEIQRLAKPIDSPFYKKDLLGSGIIPALLLAVGLAAWHPGHAHAGLAQAAALPLIGWSSLQRLVRYAQRHVKPIVGLLIRMPQSSQRATQAIRRRIRFQWPVLWEPISVLLPIDDFASRPRRVLVPKWHFSKDQNPRDGIGHFANRDRIRNMVMDVGVRGHLENIMHQLKTDQSERATDFGAITVDRAGKLDVARAVFEFEGPNSPMFDEPLEAEIRQERRFPTVRWRMADRPGLRYSEVTALLAQTNPDPSDSALKFASVLLVLPNGDAQLFFLKEQRLNFEAEKKAFLDFVLTSAIKSHSTEETWKQKQEQLFDVIEIPGYIMPASSMDLSKYVMGLVPWMILKMPAEALLIGAAAFVMAMIGLGAVRVVWKSRPSRKLLDKNLSEIAA